MWSKSSSITEENQYAAWEGNLSGGIFTYGEGVSTIKYKSYFLCYSAGGGVSTKFVGPLLLFVCMSHFCLHCTCDSIYLYTIDRWTVLYFLPSLDSQ